MKGRPAGPARKIAEAIQEARREYRRMCANLRAGGKLPLQRIEESTVAAGRTLRDLIRDTLAATSARETVQPGDPCGQCGGHLRIYSTKTRGVSRVQYLHCGQCKHRPRENKRVVSEGTVAPRREPGKKKPV